MGDQILRRMGVVGEWDLSEFSIDIYCFLVIAAIYHRIFSGDYLFSHWEFHHVTTGGSFSRS